MKIAIVAALVSAALAAVAPGPPGGPGAPITGCPSKRPKVVASPYQPRLPIPNPPPRRKICFVRSHGDGVTDDSQYILQAFHECNYGGHVVFNKNTKPFIIGTAMDWTFLRSIDIGMAAPCVSLPLPPLPLGRSYILDLSCYRPRSRPTAVLLLCQASQRNERDGKSFLHFCN